jgi:hypothetical protein
MTTVCTVHEDMTVHDIRQQPLVRQKCTSTTGVRITRANVCQ